MCEDRKSVATLATRKRAQDLPAGGRAAMMRARRWGVLAGVILLAGASGSVAQVIIQNGRRPVMVNPAGNPPTTEKVDATTAAGQSSIRIVEKSEFRNAIN